MPSVEQRIRDTFRDAGAAGWLHAVPVVEAPNREVAVGADDQVVMASVYKLPLLVALCQRFAKGTLAPTATVRVHPRSGSPGPTGVAAFQDPVTLSWRDLAASMIAVSDNAAADVILGEVGLAAVHETLTDCGLTGTKVVGGQADVEAALVRDTGATSAAEAFALLADNDQALTVSAYDPAFASATTARDMTSLLSQVWQDAVVTPEQCAYMRRLMALQVWPHRVRAGFPYAGVEIGGKTGTIGAIRNEVAVVTFPGETPVAVAIFTYAARADAALPAVDTAIGECARLAVTELRSGRW